MRSVSDARAVRKMIGIDARSASLRMPFADVEAVGIRQHDVQQDQVGPHLPAQIDGALAGLQSTEGEAFFLQVVFQERK